MKKFLVLIILSFVFSGCATYKFQKQDPAAVSGYVVSYDGKIIPEYTVGGENSFPDLALAQERFQRRKESVEYYYRKMDQIQGRFKELFWDPPAMLVDLLGGILRWPIIAINDYKYNRNPKYKAKIDKLDEEKAALEKAREDELKTKLQAYISADINKEISSSPKVAVEVAPILGSAVSQPAPAAVVAQTEAVSAAPIAVAPEVIKTEPVVVEEVETVEVAKPSTGSVLAPPVAVISAQPLRGYSPLTVKFSGQKSFSQSGKIVAYDWNFGDGDTSNKKSPSNTYWSTTYGARQFTVLLTVKDEAGNTASANTVVEVTTR